MKRSDDTSVPWRAARRRRYCSPLTGRIQGRRPRRHQGGEETPCRHRPWPAALRHDRRQDAADRFRRRNRPTAGRGPWRSNSSWCRPPGASRIPSLQSGKADVVISTLSVTAGARQGDRLLASLCVAAHRGCRHQGHRASRPSPISTARPSARRAAPPTTPISRRTPRMPRSCATRTMPPTRRPSSAARSTCSPPPNCCLRRSRKRNPAVSPS